jgi:hypothetical protein
MTVFAGFIPDGVFGHDWSGASTSLGTPPQWQIEEAHDGEFLRVLGDDAFGQKGARAAAAARARRFSGILPDEISSTFFESIVVIPRKQTLGFILANQTFSFDVYNAYRREKRILSSWVNNSDAGIDQVNMPSLPHTYNPLQGQVLVFSITEAGAPEISGDIDFVFDTETIVIPVTGQRAIMFAFEPDTPVVERLLFKTDIMRKRDGREQRYANRPIPRQVFDLTYSLTDFERELFDTILFDSGARALGLPVWVEPMVLTADAPAGTLTVNVETTAYADLRGTVMLFRSPEYFESLELDSFTADTVTFKTESLRDFGAGERLYPVRIAFPGDTVRGEKIGKQLQISRLTFAVEDNDADLSDASGFSSFGGFVLIDDPNMVDPTLQETLFRQQAILDNDTGTFEVSSEVFQGRRGQQKIFFSNSRRRLWQIRQLFHFLKGRAVSFYIPTFFEELVPVATVTSGLGTMTIRNVGYTKFIQSRKPRNVIRVVKTDGTSMTATITSSSEIDVDTEQLNVTPTWPSTATISQIERVEMLTRCRIDEDVLTIKHTTAKGDATAAVPMTEVFE